MIAAGRPMEMLFATRNPNKVALFVRIFAARGFRLLSLRDLPDDPVPADEEGASAEENALAKARAHHGLAHPWVFGDDAGLEIDALDGEPGLQARRWNGRFSDEVDDATWLEYLLGRLRGVPPGRRTARFVAAWALIAPDGSEHVRRVVYPFEIAERTLRPMRPGSPISAVRVGPPDDLAARQEDLAREFAAWGVLERLLRAAEARSPTYREHGG